MDNNVGILVIVGTAILLLSHALMAMFLVKYFNRKLSLAIKAANRQPALAPKLSRETVARLEARTQAAFQTSVDQAIQHFQQDIDKTSASLNELIVRLTTAVVEEELVQYRQGLAAARTSALSSLTGMQQAVDDQQALLQADMRAAIDRHQTELLERLDRDIATIATNYIVEALGQGVDLGAQRDYLLASLERNKTALRQDITGEL